MNDIREKLSDKSDAALQKFAPYTKTILIQILEVLDFLLSFDFASFCILMRIKIGSRETEVNELAVKPKSFSSILDVITVTPVT